MKSHKNPINSHKSRKLPVLDLQQVAHQAVAGAAAHEVPLGAEERLRVVIPVLLPEIIQQGELRLLLDLVDGDGVEHGLDHPAVRRDHQDLVGLDPQRDALLLPDGLRATPETRQIPEKTRQIPEKNPPSDPKKPRQIPEIPSDPRNPSDPGNPIRSRKNPLNPQNPVRSRKPIRSRKTPSDPKKPHQIPKKPRQIPKKPHPNPFKCH